MYRSLVLFFCFSAVITVVLAQPNDDRSEKITTLFKAKCVDSLVNYEAANVADLSPMDEASIKQLETALGNSFAGWKLWFDNQSHAILSLKDAADPNPCTLMVFGLPHASAAATWRRLEKMDGIRINGRFSPHASKKQDQATIRDGAQGVIHASGVDFVQTTLNFWGNVEKGTLVLVSVRVPQSKYACELFPEKCDQ
ncbi:hypothetical protein PsAD13_05057 [Pseudovibrio sp. Ad13]|uniref:hypothetical protein n=1 Tax=Pseudovibrio sp. Ad13 TaxID=989396 RepID=UPI0007AE4FDE|nr:hypothetical protein [Pseudovibrio sp. Ad13]KZK79711.1 hypothetical protein PsAD13_05057 [Pseudovibrio sp. Ad13]